MRRVLQQGGIYSNSFTYSVTGRRVDAKRLLAWANFGPAELVPEGKGKFAKDSRDLVMNMQTFTRQDRFDRSFP
jgi:hypothetical protein